MRGDFCGNADGVVFDLVATGLLPVAALGLVHRGVCTNKDHTPHCLARYHRRTFKLSACAIRRYLAQNPASSIELVCLAKAIKQSHRETGFWLRALHEHVAQVPTLRAWAQKIVAGPHIRVATYYFAVLTGCVGGPGGALLWKRQEDFRLYTDVQWYLAHLGLQPRFQTCYGSDSTKRMVTKAVSDALGPHLPPELVLQILEFLY